MFEMSRNVKLETGYRYRQESHPRSVAKIVLSNWDKRQKVFANARIPNDEMCLNILLFLIATGKVKREVPASDIAARFASPQSTISRYLRLLDDADLIQISAHKSELVATLTAQGLAVLEELYDWMSPKNNQL